MSSLFEPRFVRTGVTAANRVSLLSDMASDLETAGYVKPTFTRALLDREEKFPTGLPTQVVKVAIPHTDAEHVDRSLISIVRLAEPVAFAEMGANDRAVDAEMVFMLAISDAKAQLGTLQALIGMLSDERLMKTLRDCHHGHELYDVVVDRVTASLGA